MCHSLIIFLDFCSGCILNLTLEYLFDIDFSIFAVLDLIINKIQHIISNSSHGFHHSLDLPSGERWTQALAQCLPLLTTTDVQSCMLVINLKQEITLVYDAHAGGKIQNKGYNTCIIQVLLFQMQLCRWVNTDFFSTYLRKNIGEVFKVLDKDALHDVRIHCDHTWDDSIVSPICLGTKLAKVLLVDLIFFGRKRL